jgi:hypothetical protein
MKQEPNSIASPASTSTNDRPPESQDFSLVLGGPLYQLLRRSHLTDDALQLVRQL